MDSLLSIEIGTANFHIAEGLSNKGSILVGNAMTFPIPENCISAEVITNLPVLTEALSEALRVFRPKSKNTVLTFNATNAIVRDIDLPSAKAKELNEMIRSELVQVYHVLPSDVIQYKEIGSFSTDESARMKKYRAVAIDLDTIEQYYSLLIDSKLKPVAMDINVNTIDKLFTGDITVNDRILSGNGTMLLDFGKTTTTIYIMAKGNPLFHRHISIGSGEIERMINDETFTSELEIRKLKERGYDFFGNDEAAKKYFAIMKPIFYNLMDEIRKIMGYFTSRNTSGNGGIDQIYLYGGGSNLAGFAEYCESNLNIQTEEIKIISKVKFVDAETQISGYINAIGALIRNN